MRFSGGMQKDLGSHAGEVLDYRTDQSGNLGSNKSTNSKSIEDAEAGLVKLSEDNKRNLVLSEDNKGTFSVI